MASDYSPPRLVKPTPGGNPGDASVDGALTVQANKAFTTPSAVLYVGTQELINDQGGGTFKIDTGGGPIQVVHQLELFSNILEFNNVATAGNLGLSPIYGLGQRVTVAATTSPGTTIATFTPGATGSFKVNVTIKNKDTTSVTAYVLVSYTDPDVGAQTVLIINGVSIGASGIASAHFVLDSTATAITVSAYGSVADELVGTADIEQFA